MNREIFQTDKFVKEIGNWLLLVEVDTVLDFAEEIGRAIGVEERGRTELMLEFHRQLLTGKTAKAKALRLESLAQGLQMRLVS